MLNYLLLVLTGLFFKLQDAPIKNQGKPNILVILIDDAGYADFGFMGSKDLKTPNIDKLASKSMIFTDAHVSSSVCSPSRAGLLTGRYQQRFGYECNEGEGYTGMDTSQVSIAQMLKNSGYTTAALGKWHLGFDKNQQPKAKGFDYFYGFLGGSRSYFYNPNKDDKSGSKIAIQENTNPIKFDGYLTDVLGNKAADFIKENKDHPFFMYWSPNAVHTPMEASEADLAKFKGHPRQKLAAMTFALDRAVGKIIDALKKQGKLENTLIFFLSDNGGAHNNQSTNLPLKGFKGNEFEAGHRIPFLMSWPAKQKNGFRFNGLSSSLDLFATCLDAAKIKTKPTNKIDGVSLLPFLTGTAKGNPHEELFWRKDANAAVRKQNYKLIRVRNVGYRLYNLQTDLGETLDLQKTDTLLFKTLKNDLSNWESDKMKPIWTEGKIWDTITEMIHIDLMNNQEIKVKSPEDLKKNNSKNEGKK
jgi:arylsulfatase A-like enzyme